MFAYVFYIYIYDMYAFKCIYMYANESTQKKTINKALKCLVFKLTHVVTGIALSLLLILSHPVLMVLGRIQRGQTLQSSEGRQNLFQVNTHPRGMRLPRTTVGIVLHYFKNVSNRLLFEWCFPVQEINRPIWIDSYKKGLYSYGKGHC